MSEEEYGLQSIRHFIKSALLEGDAEKAIQAISERIFRAGLREIEDQTFALMNQNISGGILGCYFEEGKSECPIYFVNDGMLNYLGFTRAEFEEKYRNDICLIVKESDRKEFRSEMEQTIRKEKPFRACYRILRKNNDYLWMEIRGQQGKDLYEKSIWSGVFVDVTEMVQEQRALEEKTEKLRRKTKRLERLLECDPLTGLYNKLAIEHYIGDQLEGETGEGVFLMLDIDHFKEINDRYGHPYGDEVLREAGKVLHSSFRGAGIAGRLGGDEFCVFLKGKIKKKTVEIEAGSLCESFRRIPQPYNGELKMSCSIGITICAGEEKSFGDLYQEADAALYTVKKRGRDGYAFFDGNDVGS